MSDILEIIKKDIEVVEIITEGPKGPQGPQGERGDAGQNYVIKPAQGNIGGQRFVIGK